MLIRRWGILWRPLECKFARRGDLIGACMRLHNYCIDKRIADEEFGMNGELQALDPDEEGVHPARWQRSPECR